MDFYISLIIIEIDGVDVWLQLFGVDGKLSLMLGSKILEDMNFVLNMVDFVQLFFEIQFFMERKELEEVFVVEIQDFGVLFFVSDDGSEEDYFVGIG